MFCSKKHVCFVRVTARPHWQLRLKVLKCPDNVCDVSGIKKQTNKQTEHNNK